jgi:hypothetical protein
VTLTSRVHSCIYYRHHYDTYDSSLSVNLNPSQIMMFRVMNPHFILADKYQHNAIVSTYIFLPTLDHDWERQAPTSPLISVYSIGPSSLGQIQDNESDKAQPKINAGDRVFYWSSDAKVHYGTVTHTWRNADVSLLPQKCSTWLIRPKPHAGISDSRHTTRCRRRRSIATVCSD